MRSLEGRSWRFVVSMASAMALVACGGDGSGGPKAGANVPTGSDAADDAVADVAAPDAATADVATGDSGAEEEDVAPDVVVPDVTAPDAGPDVPVVPAGPECPTGFAVIDEAEPNDLTDGTFNEVSGLSPGGAGVCIRGTVTCGNDGSDYVGDVDGFAYFAQLQEALGLAVEMHWDDPGDLDVIVYEDGAQVAIKEIEDQPDLPGPGQEVGHVVLHAGKATFIAQAGCWAANSDSVKYIITLAPEALPCVGSCDDGFPCTTDACESGKCTHTPDDAACDDADPCTIDACNPAAGCTAASPCTAPNKGQCTAKDGQPVCGCDGGWVEVDGVCTDATPCDPNPCTEPHRTVCVADGVLATCACDDGWADDGDACKDLTPCDPNPCVEPHNTVCTADGFSAACTCDDGWALDGGVCKDVSPCDPNPCQVPKTACTESGFQALCSCTDPTAVGPNCLAPCPAGQHDDGDASEPNECASLATSLAAVDVTAPGGVTSLTIGPSDSDVDFFVVKPPAAGHSGWLLFDVDNVDCGIGKTMSGTVAPYDRAASVAPGASLTFSCKKKAGSSAAAPIAYKIKYVDFPLGADASDDVTSPTKLASKTLIGAVDPGYDQDCIETSFSLPTTISTMGGAVYIFVNIKKPTFSDSLDCPEASSLSLCGNLGGTGDVTATFCMKNSINYSDSTTKAYYIVW